LQRDRETFVVGYYKNRKMRPGFASWETIKKEYHRFFNMTAQELPMMGRRIYGLELGDSRLRGNDAL